MAKFLKDIVKPKSTKVTNDLGGYAPKSGDEQDFVKKHEIEKHDDRNGNGDDVFKGKTKYVLDKPEEKRHGYKKPEDAKVNESKKAEDVSCNHTSAGTKCPVHEMADCTGSKTIKEEVEQIYEVWYVQHKDGSRTHHESGTAAMKASRKSPGSKVGATHGYGGMKAADALKPKTTKEEVAYVDEMHSALTPHDHADAQKMTPAEIKAKHKKYLDTADHHSKRMKNMSLTSNQRMASSTVATAAKMAAIEWKKKYMKEEVEQVDEVITKKTSAGEVISDFVHSKNPKFAGKSKEKRKEMALAAYYAKQREQKEEVEQIDEAFDKNSKAHQAAKKTVKGMKGLARAEFHPNGSASVHTKGNENVSSTRVVDHHHDIHGLGYNRPESAYKKSSFKKDGLTHRTQSVHGGHTIHIHEEVKKHVKAMNEELAIPLLGGDHPPRGDSEEAIEMVKSELKALANKAMHLVMQMPQGMHVEPWCQAKIAQAKSYVSDVHDYMIYGDHEDEKDEQMDTPLTFPNMSVDVNTGQNV